MKSQISKVIYISNLFISLLLFSSKAEEIDSTKSILWDISSLTNIGGHPVTVNGDPQVIFTDKGDAIQFDGIDDRILLDFNPIGDAKEFTVEVVFMPSAAYGISNQPRFIHIQDPGDPSAKRVMMELRIKATNEWYLDGFMKTDAGQLTLIDSNYFHPTEDWMHAAITYKEDTFRTFVNGIAELKDTVKFTSNIINTTGQTSIGSRLNLVQFYKGIVKTLKITNRALEPSDFLINIEAVGITEINSNMDLRIFPNPGSYIIKICFSTNERHKSDLAIYNLIGEMVYFEELVTLEGENELNINTSDFQDGMYILKLKNRQGFYAAKFSVRH